MAHYNEKKNTGKIKKTKVLRDNCVSAQKSINYSTKTINISRYAFLQRCVFYLKCLALIGFVHNVILRQGIKICKYDQK